MTGVDDETGEAPVSENEDFEVLKAIFMYAMPAEKSEYYAKALLARYGGLANVASRPFAELLTAAVGIDKDAVLLLKVMYAVVLQVHKES